MRLKESARFAWTGVVANKMRSLLTMLGIIIGVASVITLVAVGTGSNAAVQASINRLGSNSLFVLPTATVAGGQGSAFLAQARRMLGLKASPDNNTRYRKPVLTMEDAAAVVDNPETPHVTGVTPAVVVRSVPTVLGSSSHTTQIIIGATPAYLTINNDTIAAGSLFTDADYLAHRRVAVVGTSVAADLVDGDSAELVGKTIRINGQPFLVTGILGSKGYSGQQDLDDKIFANESAVADSLYGYYPPGQSPLSALDVQVEPGHSADAQIEVTKLLLKRHQVDMANPDFVVFNPSAVLAAGSSANKTLTILLAAVAGISLLVGGIGVMNIMLVSVTERTREIGIRKAIGGNRRDIIAQFLGEAVILSMIGGTIGVVIGVTVAHFPIAGVQPQIAPYSIYLAFGVSLFTGLFFGFYPASRAASLRPIEALRYE
ncbi:MAG TPA: ABC transporter permease [Sporichthyaceae bacterium]|jgi:putative ABC transport system permease protein|nr:ABC transporter permease [Sporichthyaceae bacterium]